MNEILQASWFEHKKYLDEMGRILPPDHPKLIKVRKAVEEMNPSIDKQSPKNLTEKHEQ